MCNQEKIRHSLEFDQVENLHWYTGLYLGLPRVFMSIVRKKIVETPIVHAILIPIYKIEDPITGRELSVHITDRYFFVGTTQEILREADIGIQSHLGTITLMRHETVDIPVSIRPQEIKQVIYNHVNKRRDIIQKHVTVCITGGTFKDWEGEVIDKPADDPDKVKVNFHSDEYEYSTDVPVALCRPAY